MWRRFFCLIALVIALMTLMGGCLSPTTLRLVADQNSENISNYNANVAAVANALKREAAFHGELEIQIARNKLSSHLVQLLDKAILSEPTTLQLADPNEEPHKSLKQTVEKARAYCTEASDILDDKQYVDAALATKYPLAADIVTGTSGFSIIRVLQDAFALLKVNEQVEDANDPEVEKALMRQRNRLLDPYLSVRSRAGLVQTHLDALDEYLSLVTEQGQVAASHANAISTYARARPRVSTLASALQDEELRSGVLALVRKRKGEAYAARVQDYLGKADDVVHTICGLSK